jgi:quercetin dioxygenase-like cupin family protein
MSERVMQANQEQYEWDTDPADAGKATMIRWRTLVSGTRTPSKGLSTGVLEAPPGAELAPHHHHPQEVYFVTGGEGEVYRDGDWRPLRTGDVVYFPGDAVHGLRNRGTSTCTVVWIFPTDTYEEIEYIDD